MIANEGHASTSKLVRMVKRITGAREGGMVLVLILLVVVLSIISPGFMSVNNLLNVGRQTALTGIMAIGVGLVTITGNMDLSIGSVYGISGVMAAMVMVRTQNAALAIACGILVGLVVGMINGFLVVKVRMPSFVATFGMMYVSRGISLILTLGYPITLFVEGITAKTHPGFHFLGRGLLFGQIPMQLAVMLGAMLALGYVLHRTIWGLHLFAVGGSEKASFAAGISVRSVRFWVFVISGIGAAVAGILNLSFIGSVLPTAGQGLEFMVFASVIIGGTSMTGGEGSMLGIFVGATILGIINNGLVLLGIGPFWQLLIIGVISILAVTWDMLTWQRRQSKRMAVA